MKIAALILGILAGLTGLSIATLGHALIGAGGGSGGAILYLLPIASFLGGGLALNIPGASGALLLGSALAWFLLGVPLGYGINIITVGSLMLNAVGGILALAAWGQEGNAQPLGSKIQRTDSSGVHGAHQRVTSAYQYDQAKWQALLQFDPEIARVEATLRQYGQKYIDQFAAGYLVLNDKSYISNIIKKVVETARQDAAEAKAADEQCALEGRASEQRWGKQFSNPAFVLEFARERFSFLISRPYGSIAIFKNGSVLLRERNGEITTYPDATALREAMNDEESWPDIADPESKIRFIRSIAAHIST